jgi:aminoglycoside/choline kinase family phosphotransferase
MNDKTKESLIRLYKKWNGQQPHKIEQLPVHGSYRKYYRIFGINTTAIGAHNEDKSENIAFLTFSRHFYSEGLAVPEIYAESLDDDIYLEEDLGDTTLFSYLTDIKNKGGFSDQIIRMYEKVIEILPSFQVAANRNLDYSVCYPRHSFDKQSMMWDLNYFKYYFLKLAQIPFDEQRLEDDFQNFTDFLLEADRDFFLYRDFQSRNIMIKDAIPYFIDYQGGRKGALQYDIASLLYDAKADIPQEIRDHLLKIYIERVGNIIKIDSQSFVKYYYGYVFVRIMQALGAYGFRGFYERKTHFLSSVPYAIQNLEYLLHTTSLPVPFPALMDALSRIVQSSHLRQLGDVNLKLTVRIQSFSYKRGIPWDEKGHGGGFVMDCRALPNPGRFPEYADINGNDKEVIEFLEKEEQVRLYLKNIFNIMDQIVINYQKLNFTDLMIAFGCTGGQHRSVYCANRLHDYLNKNYNIYVEIRHRELE